MLGGIEGFVMTLFMLMLVALVILGVLALVRYLKLSKQPAPGSGDNALVILNERYARGEINDEEYTAKKALLSKP